MSKEIAIHAGDNITDVLSAPDGAPPLSTAVPELLERAIAATQDGTCCKASLRAPLHWPSKEQKAAIIVRLLQSNSDGIALTGLNTENLARLVHATASLSFVDEATILGVIQDFLSEIDSLALYFQPGLEGAIETLSSHLNDDVTKELSYTPTPEIPDDPWTEVAALEADVLAAALSDETPQTNAVILSRLAPDKSAEILAELDPQMADATTNAALGIGHVGLRAVADIGGAIACAAKLSGQAGGLPGGAVDRVGAMLNSAPGADRERLLASLEAADQDLAEQVRRIMFTFADIPDRVEIADIPKLVRAVDNDIMVTALAGGKAVEKETVEFIFSNLSKRLSEQLEEEVRETGEVKPKDADTAMNAVIQAVRDLEQSGEITLITPEI